MKWFLITGVFILSMFTNVYGGDAGISTSYNKRPILLGSTELVYADFVTVGVFFDDFLKSRSGAGYIVGLNVSYAPKKEKIELFTSDLYIGKRIFIVPKLIHVYFKIGSSVSFAFFPPDSKSENYSIKLGGIASSGIQIQVLRGVKVFSEYEFRKYSEVSTWEKGNTVDYTFRNTLPNKEDVLNPDDRKSLLKRLTFGIKFLF